MQLKIRTKEFKVMIVVFFIGLILPFFLTHQNFKIYDSINRGLEFWDKEHILIAMFKLVFLNTLRAIPIYISMFLMFDSIELIKKEKVKIIEKILFILPVIPIMYKLIDFFYEIHLPIGKTSILGILWFCYYIRFNFKTINFLQKNLVFLSFIVGLQWLDVSGYFNFLGVGEITSDLNKVIDFMGGQLISSLLCISFFIFFTSNSILLLYFFKGQENIIARYESELENRHLKEVQQVVHDLKTPIFSIGTLLEVLMLQEEDERKKNYLNRIGDSIEKTNLMISEILKFKSKKPILIDDMMNFVFSFLSVHKNLKKIIYNNYTEKNHRIYGNRVLLSRIIINIIVNAWEANSEKVIVTIKGYRKYTVIKIEDYGDGIEDGNLEKLLQEGFSTKDSSGKGLSFVNKAIKEFGGKIFILKKIEKGLNVFVVLKGEVKNEKSINC
ncbi:MAG: HAMP domain-containing sensor histidine kinase [Cetobacterium sp.]